MAAVSVQTVSPFLKWAGGKRWLNRQIPDLLPKHYGTYFEPFLGGAAMFFAEFPQRAILSDLNADLISTYNAIRKDWRQVSNYLRLFSERHSATFYYSEREVVSDNPFENAARFIYLNRVCWNGLYRVNLKGKFNVPLGTKTSVLLESDDFEQVARQLEAAILINCDFEQTVDAAGKGDFVYVDPPYITSHNFNGFIKYNERIFSWEDQTRLRNAVKRAAARGAMVLVSNADHQSVRRLYRGIGTMSSVPRMSIIAAASQSRSVTTELLIRTYE